MIKQIWTVGHSTRSIDDFIAALEANEIKLVADVRLLPGSKRHPQFNKGGARGFIRENTNALRTFSGIRWAAKAETRFPQHSLAQRSISRLRRSHGDERISERNRSAPEFGGRNRSDCDHVRGGHLVALPSRAHFRFSQSARHRSLHILDAKKTQPHPFTSAARIVNEQLTYRSDEQLL